MQLALKPTLYEQMEGLPEGLTREILNGQMHTQPRPAVHHLRVEASLGSKDREIKMPIYAHYGVTHLWLVDPKRRTLETYTLNGGKWESIAQTSGDRIVALPPFEAMQLELASLWC